MIDEAIIEFGEHKCTIYSESNSTRHIPIDPEQSLGTSIMELAFSKDELKKRFAKAFNDKFLDNPLLPRIVKVNTQLTEARSRLAAAEALYDNASSVVCCGRVELARRFARRAIQSAI